METTVVVDKTLQEEVEILHQQLPVEIIKAIINHRRIYLLFGFSKTSGGL
jgi:hypothetical protein